MPGSPVAEVVRVLSPGGVLLILGYGRRGGWRDLLDEVRDAVVQRIVPRGMQAWEQATAKADPRETWSGVRNSARDWLTAPARCRWIRVVLRRTGVREG
ncbi:MAG: Ubiquinone/menaquinone biosynthesis C-methyltransferase UbiE [Nocardioides sp.]|nr:Ubiquinone/menaquinone biosynthesis C-methyltransferase UbiE [Nocardioides sp.]